VEASFKIIYEKEVVERDIPALPNPWDQKIKQTIEGRLTRNPALYGKPLRRLLTGYRKLRVGDYRVIYGVGSLTVRILIIDHRSTVYQEVLKRI